MKIMSFIGARPQFIKVAPIDHELANRDVEHIIVHSGQHYDDNMSEIFFKELGISVPHYNLEVGSDSHGRQTAKMIERFEEVVLREKPDVILLYGDTNTTVAGSLVASKLLIPVAHVEAGLRSYSKKNPEEVNRVVTDAISDLLLPPSERYVNILKSEGKSYILEDGKLWSGKEKPEKTPVVVNVGDVMYDAMLYVLGRVDEKPILDSFDVSPKSYVYMTIHRPYNTDNPESLISILRDVERIAQDMPVLFAVHPRTRKRIQEYGIEIKDIRLVEPQPFSVSIVLQKNARLIITDSGGITKESFILGTRALIVRDEVEWVETVESGFHKLVKPHSIYHVYQEMLKENVESLDFNPYGDGYAARRIADLCEILSDIYKV